MTRYFPPFQFREQLSGPRHISETQLAFLGYAEVADSFVHIFRKICSEYVCQCHPFYGEREILDSGMVYDTVYIGPDARILAL